MTETGFDMCYFKLLQLMMYSVINRVVHVKFVLLVNKT